METNDALFIDIPPVHKRLFKTKARRSVKTPFEKYGVHASLIQSTDVLLLSIWKVLFGYTKNNQTTDFR
jgi:hypothetical protein